MRGKLKKRFKPLKLCIGLFVVASIASGTAGMIESGRLLAYQYVESGKLDVSEQIYFAEEAFDATPEERQEKIVELTESTAALSAISASMATYAVATYGCALGIKKRSEIIEERFEESGLDIQ